MTIICGLDFSKWSSVAATAAASIAGRLGQQLTLVHVVEPQVETVDPEHAQSLERRLLARVQAEAERVRPLTTAPIEVMVLSGRPDEVLRLLAVNQKASLVVVGSMGHGKGSLLTLGGTSERLASGAEVPVLVVRDEVTFKDWGRGAGLKALLGLDEDETSNSALRWLEALRQVAPVDVLVGRVYYQDQVHQQYGLSRRFSYTDVDPRVEAMVVEELKGRVPTLAGAGELTWRAKLAVGRVADHLLELAEAERCQLVVVGSHRRHGLARLWSVSSATLHLARMAVVVVPPDGEGPTPARARLKRVVVSTDFSTLGNAALPWAYAVAEPGAEVFLTNVSVTTGLAGELLEQMVPAAALVPVASADVQARVAARLRDLVPATAQQKGIVTRTEVLQTPHAARAIVELAQRVAADAIVLSSHGRTGLARTLLGSVAEEVLRTSRKPVFIVRGSLG